MSVATVAGLPDRVHWLGLASESAQLCLGGVTVCIDWVLGVHESTLPYLGGLTVCLGSVVEFAIRFCLTNFSFGQFLQQE